MIGPSVEDAAHKGQHQEAVMNTVKDDSRVVTPTRPDLAGYRSGPVYIRRSMHVPPRKPRRSDSPRRCVPPATAA